MDDLKVIIRTKNLKMWRIAKEIGISAPTLSVWMREYNKQHHEKILNAINKVVKE